MYNVFDHGNLIKCAVCKRDVGMYDDQGAMVLLYGYRKCTLTHVSTVADGFVSAVPSVVIENRLTEIENVEDFSGASYLDNFVSLVTDFNVPPENVQPICEVEINADYSLLCNEFMPNEGELQRANWVVNTAERSSIDEAIENVVAGRDMGRLNRAPIEFVEYDRLPMRTNNDFDSSLATLLPGKNMPEFKY